MLSDPLLLLDCFDDSGIQDHFSSVGDEELDNLDEDDGDVKQ